MKSITYPPIYTETATYAREHNEIAAFRESNIENRNCKLAIQEAIERNFDGTHLSEQAVHEVVKLYGKVRVWLILANTVNWKNYDGRFSQSNKQWAKEFEMAQAVFYDPERSVQYVLDTHPYVLDGFINVFRRLYAERLG